MPDMVIAEFDEPEAAVQAARRVRELGYRDVDAYGPFPVPELSEALAIPRSRVSVLAFLAGGAGATSGIFLQWWCNAFDYPLDVGGRPFASWPTYIVIAFEATVLFAAFATFGAVLLGSKMPRLHDPVFDLPGFERTTLDRFWITIRHADVDELAKTLREHGAVEVRYA